MSVTSFEQIKMFMRGLSSLISKATKTANSAEETAKKASTSVAEKMNAIDPAGSGSFSMNRKSGTTVGVRSHAEGSGCTASGMSSHAEGYDCAATNGYAHAEGYQTVASSGSAHAEGSGTKATAVNTHAEGNNTTASAREAHAEGMHTIASGEKAHSEGWLTEARAEASHAEGIGTIANGAHQHVQGRYNIEDGKSMTGKYAHIVGNGYEDPGYSPVRSNAHTLDWDGNAWFAGDVYVGGTNQDEGKKLLTEDTLPVATADTLGAVKVGAGLTVDSDGVLSASEGVYELIETITLEEDCHIERTEEPDGTPYKFTAMFLRLTAIDMLIPNGGHLLFRHDGSTIASGFLSSKNEVSSYYAIINPTKEYGYWKSRWGNWQTNSTTVETNSGNDWERGVKYSVAQYPCINQVLTTWALPAGTVIEIWGVRA